MSRDDWYRNTRWDSKVAEAFESKLKRAKRKGQYLRIQASTLAESNPQIALELLDRYFQQPYERFQDAQAYVDRATALLALGRPEEAVVAYEAALQQEKKTPNITTLAYVELPYIVSVHRLASHYENAGAVLQRYRERPVFPVEFFMWHASTALIADASGDRQSAKQHAKEALEFAAKDRSGFQRHPNFGLVTERHNEALRKLRAFCDA